VGWRLYPNPEIFFIGTCRDGSKPTVWDGDISSRERRKIMKNSKKILTLALVGVLLAIFLSSCGGGISSSESGGIKYAFLKGEIDNFYYILDENDQPLCKVIGKPYMIVEYDPITGVPKRVEFGLDEARNEYLPGSAGCIPEPFMSANPLPYANKLGLKGPVDLLLNWNTVTSHSELSGGGYEFKVVKPKNSFGQETYHFVYTFNFDGMEGEIINPTATWGGRVSDTKVFKLLKKFDSTTLY
jgi:hypothetical protein